METSNDWLRDDPQRALKILYSQHYPWLCSYIKKNAGDNADAEDVFQESLVVAWIGLKTGRFSGSNEKFGAYLRQICKYKWISHLRSAKFKRMQTMADMTDFDLAEDFASVEEQSAQAKLLTSSLAELGEKCKKVLQAFYFERKSLAEIAVVEANTEESLKTIKYRCMQQLRKIYINKQQENGER